MDAEIIFLALPAPTAADGSADLKYVLGVADHLGKILKGYKVIVKKNTVPVETADKVSAAIAKNYTPEYDVVSNPEFLRDGVAVDDFMKPDRVFVGTRSERAKKLMSDSYAPYVRQGNPVIFIDERSSELTEYAADIRKAPAFTIIDALTSAGATVTAYDPEAMPNLKGQIGAKIRYASNQYDALQNTAALIIATEWREFRTPDFELMDQKLNQNKIIFDGRNLFDVARMHELGYHYESIGRADSNKTNK